MELEEATIHDIVNELNSRPLAFAIAYKEVRPTGKIIHCDNTYPLVAWSTWLDTAEAKALIQMGFKQI